MYKARGEGKRDFVRFNQQMRITTACDQMVRVEFGENREHSAYNKRCVPAWSTFSMGNLEKIAKSPFV